MMVLYGTKGSGAAAIEAALRLTGAAYRVVDAASWKPGPGLDELRRVHPLAQVTTLVSPEGGVLSESAAILIHLGERYPASGLLPQAPLARAQSLRGLVYIAANCYAAIGVIDYPERVVPDADDALKERIRAGSRARLHELWNTFADTFPATPFLAGESVGALDLFACVVSRWSGARKHVEKSRPAFHALLQKVEADPKVAPVFADYFPPQAPAAP
jgi:GST-like protein